MVHLSKTVFMRCMLLLSVVAFSSCEADQTQKLSVSNTVLEPVIHYHYSGYGMITHGGNYANTVLGNYGGDNGRSDRSFINGLLSAFTFGLSLPDYEINISSITLQDEEDYINSITYIGTHQCN
ncbi:hypothetical protein FAZ15_00910 [Sphingobacterium olei]|uniref:Uncharacterized protein n=1 Tax=Sphingobacterium olei TaxID=2571155 RepID=A0A4U0P6E0_9SPHI|nr:hypothetical protein [Sphingobacterium olei]TJZ62899.1 hypothetical protein FAZ15_00910 [Sphingobacterium olei]